MSATNCTCAPSKDVSREAHLQVFEAGVEQQGFAGCELVP